MSNKQVKVLTFFSLLSIFFLGSYATVYYASTFSADVTYRNPSSGSYYVIGAGLGWGLGAEIRRIAYTAPETVDVYLYVDGTPYLAKEDWPTCWSGCGLSSALSGPTSTALGVGTHTYYLRFVNPDNPFDSTSTSVYTFYIEPASEDITLTINNPTDESTHYTDDAVLFRASLTTNVAGTLQLVLDGLTEKSWSIVGGVSSVTSYYIDGSDIGTGNHNVYFKFVTSRSATYSNTNDFTIETPPAEEGAVYYFGTESPDNGTSVMEGETATFSISIISNVGGELSLWIDEVEKTGWSLAAGTWPKSYDTTTLSVGNHTYYWKWDLLNGTVITTGIKVINIYEYTELPDYGFTIDTGWFSRRKPVEITTPENVVNYQLGVNLTYESEMNATGSDITFTDSDGETTLNFWQDDAQSIDSGYFFYYVLVPSLSNKTIYAYYGNETRADGSNGTKVFPSFSDFEGAIESFWTGSGHAVNNTVAVTGNYSVRSDGTAGITTTNLSSTFPIILEGSFRSANVNPTTSSYGFVGTNASGNVLWIKLRGGEIQYYDTDYRTVRNVANNTWYRIMLVLKQGATYDIYVDGVLNKSGANYRTANATNLGTINTEYFSGIVSFADRIFTRKYMETPPTIEVGAEESNVGELIITLGDPTDEEVRTEGNFTFQITGSAPVKCNITLWIGSNFVYNTTTDEYGSSFSFTRNVTFWQSGTYNVTARLQRLPITTWEDGCNVLTGVGCYYCGGYLEGPCDQANDTAVNVVIEPAVSLTQLAPSTYTYYDGEAVTFRVLVSNFMANGSTTIYLRAYTDTDLDGSYMEWATVGAWVVPAGSVDQEISKTYSFPAGNYTYWWFVTGIPSGQYKIYPDEYGQNLTVYALVMNLNPFTAFKSMVQEEISGETGYSWIWMIANILFDPWTTIFGIGIGIGLVSGNLMVGGLVMYAVAIVFSYLGWIAVPVVLLIGLGVIVAIWKMWGGA